MKQQLFILKVVARAFYHAFVGEPDEASVVTLSFLSAAGIAGTLTTVGFLQLCTAAMTLAIFLLGIRGALVVSKLD